MAVFWVFVCILFVALASLSLASDDEANLQLQERQKRSIDPVFLRRYNHLRSVYRNNPLMFTMMKYFLRNRGQRRERRQVNNNRYPSNGNNNGFVTYNNPFQQTPRPVPANPKDTKRETTRRRKPFRPPMIFF